MSIIKQRLVKQLEQEFNRDIFDCIKCGAEHSYQCVCGNEYEYPRGSGQTYDALQLISELDAHKTLEDDIRSMLPGDTIYVHGHFQIKRIR